MKRVFIMLAAFLAVNSVRSATNTASGADLDSFRIISQRNIFDPNRSPRRASRTVSSEPQRAPRTERFALLGTMSYEKGSFAFFDGTSSDYRRSLKPGDDIAGFKIAEVAPTCVRLETTNSQMIELCVGMQMQKAQDDPWQLGGKAELPDLPRNSSAPSTSSPSGAEADDVLRRLMQQREQEGGVPSVEASITNTTPSPVETNATRDNSSNDEVVKRLLQKREQELNK